MAKRMKMNAVHEEEGMLERNHYDGIDQISGLPEFIIHHIMSFLPTKDLARISLLSKTWKGIRASFPILDFDEVHCTNNAIWDISPIWVKKEWYPKAWSAWMKFRRYLDTTLLEFYETKVRMKKFKLHIPFPDLKMTLVVDKWLGMALESGVQEVDLYVRLNQLYILPESIFAARFLTDLRLYNCNFNLKQKPYSKNSLRFHSLQKLSLRYVHIEDALFNQIISSCPLIEDISLICCMGLKRFHLFGLLKLKEVVVEVFSGDQLERIDIETPCLQRFRYMSFEQTSCVVNVDMCRDVKNLSIGGYFTNTEHLMHDLISKFPSLESLCLDLFDEIKMIKISSHSLRRLRLLVLSKLVDIEIDTPNLLHFYYSSSMVLPSFINAPCSWEVRLDVHKNVDSLWLMKLKEFISKSNQIVYLMMYINSKEHTFNLEDLGEVSLPQNLGVEDLILTVRSDGLNYAALLDGLLWCFHPTIITVSPASQVKSSSSYSTYEKFIQFLSQELVKKDASFCNFHHTKCWRHFLKDAKIMNLKAGLPDEERFHNKAELYAETLFKLNHCRYILEW